MTNVDSIEMKILKINRDEDRERWPAVILTDADETVFLPVYVSWVALEQFAPKQPDRPAGTAGASVLLTKALAHLSAEPDHVLIRSIQWGKTPSGSGGRLADFVLVYRQDGTVHEMPMEADDAIALAVTRGLPIRVAAEVIKDWALRKTEPPLERGNRDDAAWERELIRRGHGAWEMERWDEACESLELLSRIPSNRSDHICALGNAEWKRGRWRAAISAWHRALGVEIDHGGYPTLVGQIGRELNRMHFRLGEGPAVTEPAPAVVEDFEDRGPSHMWISDYWAVPGRRVPAPGGRSGHAYELPYRFDEYEWPMLLLILGAARSWSGAKGFAFDAFVAPADPKSPPLRLNAYFGRKAGGRYYHEVTLKSGWNEFRLPFDSPGWFRNFPNDESVPERVELAKISPVDGMTFMLWGEGRKDRGLICLDDIRIM